MGYPDAPVVVDASPCLDQFKSANRVPNTYDVVEYLMLLAQTGSFPELAAYQDSGEDDRFVLHTPCSATKSGLGPLLTFVASKFGQVVPSQVACCGMAGDRGLRFPELVDSSLKHLNPVVHQDGVDMGLCVSRTCEIGLSSATPTTPWVSLIQLVASRLSPTE